MQCFGHLSIFLILLELDLHARSNHQKYSMKKGNLRNFRPETCNFIRKDLLAQVFSCEFCKSLKSNFFYRTPVAASVNFWCENFVPTHSFRGNLGELTKTLRKLSFDYSSSFIFPSYALRMSLLLPSYECLYKFLDARNFIWTKCNQRKFSLFQRVLAQYKKGD